MEELLKITSFLCSGEGQAAGRVRGVRKGGEHHQPDVRNQPVLRAAAGHHVVPRHKGNPSSSCPGLSLSIVGLCRFLTIGTMSQDSFLDKMIAFCSNKKRKDSSP